MGVCVMSEIDPLRGYAAARGRVEALEGELHEYGAFFGALARGLTSRPIELMLSNTGAIGWGAPAEIALSGSVPSVDYSRWPTAEVVAAKLKDYYGARHELRNAESRLSPSDRSAVGLR